MSFRNRLTAARSLVITQLKTGLTPEKLGWTLAAGSALGCFPVIGTTTLLCFLAGAAFRLNQPVLQLVNYLVYPLQLLLLVPFFALGAAWFGTGSFPFTTETLLAGFRSDFWGMLAGLGGALWLAVLVWMILVPAPALLGGFLLRFPIRLLIRRFSEEN